MHSVLAASDACIGILRNIAMFKTTYPNKIFDYMAASRPTLLAIDGVIRQVVREPPTVESMLPLAILSRWRMPFAVWPTTPATPAIWASMRVTTSWSTSIETTMHAPSLV